MQVVSGPVHRVDQLWEVCRLARLRPLRLCPLPLQKVLCSLTTCAKKQKGEKERPSLSSLDKKKFVPYSPALLRSGLPTVPGKGHSFPVFSLLRFFYRASICSCAKRYQTSNVGYRGMAGNPVNPGSKRRNC
jgi:hypothetical protein